jgi:phosphate transport system substrate-binding protein
MFRPSSGTLRGRTIAAVALFVLAVTGCARREQVGSTIQINGSSTVFPIAEAVVEEYRAEAPNVRVTVGSSGTGGGFQRFCTREIDICNASREIKTSEKEACEQAGIEYIPLKVAYDGLAVIIHPDNDWAETLTTEQLKELWRPGSPVKTWSDLNDKWPDEEITLYGPGSDSGTFDYFTEVIVGEEGASRSDYTASEDDNQLVRGITEDPYALGYFGYAYYAENKDALKLVGIDAGEGPVKPSVETVLQGTYRPLSRPLYIYVRKDSLERPEVRDFVEFYVEVADELAREVGYVPVPDDVTKENRQALESVAIKEETASMAESAERAALPREGGSRAD